MQPSRSQAGRYNAGSVAPAYRPQRAPKPDIRVVPGMAPRRSPQRAADNASLLLAARLVVVVLLIIAGMGIARIMLNSATVETALAAAQVKSEISEARAAGSALEVEKGALATTTRVKDAAKALSMASPAATTVVVLPEDVVATNEAGELSFVLSAVRAQGIGVQAASDEAQGASD